MEIRIAALADAANIAPPEKLNILGVFDTVSAANFPAVHPFMALVLRLRLDYQDGGKSHVLKVSFRDEDGTEVGRAEAKVQIGTVPAGEFAHVNQVLNFVGIRFARPGHYYFEVFWDEQAKARVDLKVTQSAAAPMRPM
jgi:hypothetical protein